MNFQTTLPYAADSDLHVIEGLDVSGTPIYQRPGDWRCKPVDMYALLQGIIERCLATQLADGSYKVSPKIYDENIEFGKYAAISQWTERTYPAGVLNEVSGYVSNLMDNYPHNLLLAAIDAKFWELAEVDQGITHHVSCYGKLTDTPPYYVPFEDIQDLYQTAGADWDPGPTGLSAELLSVPARANGGVALYGSPSSGRIYPEALIARYKVLQALRWKKAHIYEKRTASGNNPPVSILLHSDYFAGGYQSEEEWEASFNRNTTWIKDNYVAVLSDIESWAPPDGRWLDFSSFGCSLTYTTSRDTWWTWNYSEVSGNRSGPNFKTKAYGIPHRVQMYGYWDGFGDPAMGFEICGEGTPVIGRNLVWDEACIGSETVFSANVSTVGSDWPPSFPPPYIGWPASWQRGFSMTLYEPIEDWDFNFCKHNDFGGAVTWTP
jgi:hypothetical protein